MKKKRLLDSYALLVYLKKEANFQKVKEYFYQAKESGKPLLMNEINIGETYYIIAKSLSFKSAEDFLTLLPMLPISPIHNTYADIISSAKIKSRFTISYADSFVVATAMREDAIILTGDPDFKKVEKIASIEWL